jgi:hypothetical protein
VRSSVAGLGPVRVLTPAIRTDHDRATLHDVGNYLRDNRLVHKSELEAEEGDKGDLRVTKDDDRLSP